MIKYFETHAHYDDRRFNPDRGELLSKLLPEAGVSRVINIGADIESSKAGIRLAQKYDYVLASVGVHPHNVKDVKDSELDVLLEMSRNERVAAFGEIGLDFYYEHSPRDVQLRRFRDQLEVAVKTGLPVIIHSRDAHAETYAMLEEYAPRLNGGVIHCFSGGAELALAYAKLGFYIAFGGALTFPKAVKTVESAFRLPIEHIVLETDCPYIAPVPIRGKRNDSRSLYHICRKLAEIKGIKHEEAARAVWENAEKLFNLKEKQE
ncbi:MAG: TatD family hydrolase [Defluviitaleaceae bacterium]|nr:TatD family hydrolase [Defluviitaleaceae bacterium]MCL2836731.1 TatD family hydrolase [Defluviitaleaceae bacterium]